MAARSKKRLPNIENKLLKLDKLQLSDVICSICQSILLEPVTLPCFHDFCKFCFNGSVENNALCCPLCRMRIGSWLRTATKQNNIVNAKLWKFIQVKFKDEVTIKQNGEDINLPLDEPLVRLSVPGEIRREYEEELDRLQAERVSHEKKHAHETENLIRKLQAEEGQAHKHYLEKLKQDELLAKQMENNNSQDFCNNTTKFCNKINNNKSKRLRTTTIDEYLKKKRTLPVKESPLLTDDNTSTSSSTPSRSESYKPTLHSRPSPEIVPSYGKFLKKIVDKNIQSLSNMWQKKTDSSKIKQWAPPSSHTESEAQKEFSVGSCPSKITSTELVSQSLQSVPVSLPYSGFLLQRVTQLDSQGSKETDSVDSMRQELCYFKPIQATVPSLSNTTAQPLRVPGLRLVGEARPPAVLSAPSDVDFAERLCHLRRHSLPQNLPSAFVCLLRLLKSSQENPDKCDVTKLVRLKSKRLPMTGSSETCTTRNNANNRKRPAEQSIDGIKTLDRRETVRRTRSTGSIPKLVNESTPKKSIMKLRNVVSERKHNLRSDSKKCRALKEVLQSPSVVPEPVIDYSKVKLVAKNLSSPLKSCNVSKILEEQLRIEKIIEQEKKDLVMALKMDAEWNAPKQHNGYSLRGRPKRQLTLTHTLRPSKKLKA